MPNDGTHGIKLFIALTYPQFMETKKKQKWTEDEAYTQLSKVLNRTLKIAWEETIEANYSEESSCVDQNWDNAIDKFIVYFLNCKKPRDDQ